MHQTAERVLGTRQQRGLVTIPRRVGGGWLREIFGATGWRIRRAALPIIGW